jgi:hypothetical protein
MFKDSRYDDSHSLSLCEGLPLNNGRLAELICRVGGAHGAFGAPGPHGV